MSPAPTRSRPRTLAPATARPALSRVSSRAPVVPSAPRAPVTLVALLALALGLLLAAPAAASGVLDGVVRTYQGNASNWLERVAPLARQLFASLAALEFIVAGIVWLVEGRAADSILRSLVFKVLLLGFLWTTIAYFPSFVPRITAGFEAAGQEASGQVAVSPSEVVDQGMVVVAEIFNDLTFSGLLAHPAGLLVYTLVALIILLAYISIAAQLVLVLTESYIVVTGGIFFLGFSGFRGTATVADNYLLYALQVGVRIFLLYLLIAVGGEFSDDWARSLGDASFSPVNFRPLFEVLAGSLIYAFLVWRIPSHVAAQLTHNAQFRLRDALAH